MASDIQFTSPPTRSLAAPFEQFSLPIEGSMIWVLVGAIILIVTVLQILTGRARRRHRGLRGRRGTGRTGIAPVPSPGETSHAAQAEALTRVAITAQPLLNHSETKLKSMIEDWLAARELPPLALHAQVSMGEIFRVTTGGEVGRAGHSAYNAKRVDFLLVGPDMLPRAGIEYQGGGHYRKDAVLRDAIKREVFRKANIPFVEIKAKSTKLSVFRALDRAFGLPETPPDKARLTPSTAASACPMPAVSLVPIRPRPAINGPDFRGTQGLSRPRRPHGSWDCPFTC